MADDLDLKKTFGVLLEAARGGRYLSFTDIAKSHGLEPDFNVLMNLLPGHLRDVNKHCAERNWPLIGAIVVGKADVNKEKPNSQTGFTDVARELGFEFDKEQSFVEQQREFVFDCPAEGKEVLRRYWFVGAKFGKFGQDDQIHRFLEEGIWENGYGLDKEDYVKLVERMQPGDRIAIKSSYRKKKDLPSKFEEGKFVSCLKIKVVGTIKEATQDKFTVKVEWDTPLDEPKEWFYSSYIKTIHEADLKSENVRNLVEFTFYGGSQNFTDFVSNGEDEVSEFDSESGSSFYSIDSIIEDGCFLSKNEVEVALKRLESKKNLILQGPPGTGKTWLGKRLAYALIEKRDPKRMRVIQFHPSLSYEDFVRGWRPDGEGGLALIDGVFLQAINAARKEQDSPFVVIIEEINRGNPAQIFGEMLTLLEKDKRSEDEAIELAYQHKDRPNERVHIPTNLYVVGTMNIADRSLALVDLALRRRFAFITLKPLLNERWENWCEECGLDSDTIQKIREAMTVLNDKIEKDRSLGKQFRIGHSYVTPTLNEEIGDPKRWFLHVVETEISPMLEEYWYDNPDQADDAVKKLLEDFS